MDGSAFDVNEVSWLHLDDSLARVSMKQVFDADELTPLGERMVARKQELMGQAPAA
jgi:hypothetical protein